MAGNGGVLVTVESNAAEMVGLLPSMAVAVRNAP